MRVIVYCTDDMIQVPGLLTPPDEMKFVLNAHEDEIWDLSVSDDGKLLASASIDGTIKVILHINYWSILFQLHHCSVCRYGAWKLSAV